MSMHMGMSVHVAALYSCTGHALLKGSASKWHRSALCVNDDNFFGREP